MFVFCLLSRRQLERWKNCKRRWKSGRNKRTGELAEYCQFFHWRGSCMVMHAWCTWRCLYFLCCVCSRMLQIRGRAGAKAEVKTCACLSCLKQCFFLVRRDAMGSVVAHVQDKHTFVCIVRCSERRLHPSVCVLQRTQRERAAAANRDGSASPENS